MKRVFAWHPWDIVSLRYYMTVPCWTESRNAWPEDGPLQVGRDTMLTTLGSVWIKWFVRHARHVKRWRKRVCKSVACTITVGPHKQYVQDSFGPCQLHPDWISVRHMWSGTQLKFQNGKPWVTGHFLFSYSSCARGDYICLAWARRWRTV